MDKAANTEALASEEKSFAEITTLIRTARSRVSRVANVTLIDLYWRIGEYISYKTSTSQWGKGVVKQLSAFIERTIPDAKGFSASNLWRMAQFHEAYAAHREKLAPLVREISWTNNLIILSRAKSDEEREFYIRKCAVEHYTKRELDRQIDSALFERTMLGKPQVTTKLRANVPDAERFFRDSYVMEFIGKDVDTCVKETELRRSLISQMKSFILELGKDFIYMGEEYRIQVGNSDFRIDLLSFHRELQCLVAFELKTEAFKPEHLGQLNFYLEALDRDVKKAKENPTIGVLLCKDKDNEVVEYALSRSLSPTLVAEYQLCLPDKSVLQRKMREIFEQQTNE